MKNENFHKCIHKMFYNRTHNRSPVPRNFSTLVQILETKAFPSSGELKRIAARGGVLDIKYRPASYRGGVTTRPTLPQEATSPLLRRTRYIVCVFLLFLILFRPRGFRPRIIFLLSYVTVVISRYDIHV